jgi:hypothetical protein
MPETVLAALREPLRLVTDPTARTWWPALLGAVAISMVYDVATARNKGKMTLSESLLVGPLFHPSSRIDLEMLFVRGFFRVVFIACLPWTARYVAVKTRWIGLRHNR